LPVSGEDRLSTLIRKHRPGTRHRTCAALIALLSLVFVAMGSGMASAGPTVRLSGTGGGETASPSGARQSAITGVSEIPGFDFSFTKPDARAMADAGYAFAIGYVSPNPAKNLTAEALAAYNDAGILVGLVWESTAGRALEGQTAGAADGQAAEDQANAVGYPVDAVLFFAVDQDTTALDYPAIRAYAEAFNQVTRRPVGIYGEADVIDHFVTPGVQPVQYGWQTAAWSAGRLSARANLYQRVGHPGWPVPTGTSADAFDEDVAILPLPLAR
jgi:hypothetical protein